MHYREFLQEVENRVRGSMQKGDIVAVRKMRKNNGVLLDCMTVQMNENGLCPSFHMDDYFRNYLEGTPVERIAENIVSICEESRRENSSSFDFLADFENVRDRLVGHLINRKKNEDILDDVPHRDFLNLAVVYYCVLDDKSDSTGGFMVHNAMMEGWGVTEERLHHESVANMKLRYPVQFISVEELMKEFLGERAPEESGDVRLYVLSNARKIFGAVWITEQDIQEWIADFFKSDYYVLPSSVHECLLLAVQDGMDEKALLSIVTDINRTQVEDEEFLADSVYRYRSSLHCMTMAAGT